jgi:hypothetical protein
MHTLPMTKTRWQTTPGNSRSISVKDCVNEQPVIGRRAADMIFPTRQKILDAIPLVVSQAKGLASSATWCWSVGLAPSATPTSSDARGLFYNVVDPTT